MSAAERAKGYAREAKDMLERLDADDTPTDPEDRWRQEQMLRLAQTWATLAVYERLCASAGAG